MRGSQEDVDQVILDIHAAPFEPDRWQQVVESLGRLHSAESAHLMSMPVVRGARFWSVSTGISPEAKVEYSSEFAKEDAWVIEGLRLRKDAAGTICTGDELIERRLLRRTRFYNEFLAPHDFDPFLGLVLRGPAVAGSPPTAMFSLMRGVGKEPFGDSERGLLARVAPHLSLAFNTFCRAQELSLEGRALSGAMDAVTTPVFIIDRAGTLTFANAAADRVLRRAEVLRIDQGRLTPSTAVREQGTCRSALKGLLSGRAATVVLTVGSPKRTVVLSTAPMPASNTNFSSRAAAGIVWLAPMSQPAGPLKRIAELHGLTRAEESLLSLLAAGVRLSDAAVVRRISIHTARSQLKSIQRKTGWRTQGELVRTVQQLSVIDPSMMSPSRDPPD